MPNLSTTVTFLFAGDGSLASDGLSAFLQTKSNFILLAECNNGATAVAQINAQKPAIAVIDAQLPDMGAREIIEAVRATNHETKIIVLGASADRRIADALIVTGADAFVVRSGPSRHLNDAIRYVRDGGKYLAPQLTTEQPVAAVDVNDEAITNLHAAIEAQALTVARLEHAMDRAQYAIEILQQKVEQLTGTPIESTHPSSPDDPIRNRKVPPAKTGMSAVAATLVMAVIVFQFAGIMTPARGSTLGRSVKVSQAASRNSGIAGWAWDHVENARALLADRQYTSAEMLCRAVLKQDPTNLGAKRILASALFHENRISESTDVVKSMSDPSSH